MCFVVSGEKKIVEEQAKADAPMHLSRHHVTSHHLSSSLPADGNSRL